MPTLSDELQVRDWLAHWRLSKYGNVLLEHDVDSVDALCRLTEADLTEMGIEKVGAKRRFLTAIAHENGIASTKYRTHEPRESRSQGPSVFVILCIVGVCVPPPPAPILQA